MIRLKSAKDIELLAKGGKILAAILEQLVQDTVAGVTSKFLDKKVRQLLADHGVKASFLGYAPRGHSPFPAALCVSVNQAVVHGVPDERVMRDGDIVGLDLGIIYRGLYLDAARTVAVGVLQKQAHRLLGITRQALVAGTGAAWVGQTIGDIGAAIQAVVEGSDFAIVHQLVGHGVGFAVHEDPQVPNLGYRGRGLKLAAGLVIAIEPMVVTGDPAVVTADDGWTVVTADGGLAAHEEHTVAITPAGPRILTAL